MFSLTLPTRHTDTFAATGFVHSGVLLALTEMAYAAYERHIEIEKPPKIVSVQVETHARYFMPLPWREGAEIRVRTVEASEEGFVQEFEIRSALTERLVAAITHDWVWLDTDSGKRATIPASVLRRLRDDLSVVSQNSIGIE
ncbi:MAG TPA: thioesterase family protein [Dehalococcoidia bacterium]|nr:thioesterase family protein [Dehalococcoidia bacterium]